MSMLIRWNRALVKGYGVTGDFTWCWILDFWQAIHCFVHKPMVKNWSGASMLPFLFWSSHNFGRKIERVRTCWAFFGLHSILNKILAVCGRDDFCFALHLILGEKFVSICVDLCGVRNNSSNKCAISDQKCWANWWAEKWRHTSWPTYASAYLKKRYISVLLEIMLFSNLWQYHFGIFSLVDNVLANLIALIKPLVY